MEPFPPTIDAVEAAVLRTLMYADRFDFPLTLEELHARLIAGAPVPLEDIRRALGASPLLKARLERWDDHYFLKGRRGILALRERRREASRVLLARAGKFLKALGGLPYVEGIGLSGGNAFENARDRDVDL